MRSFILWAMLAVAAGAAHADVFRCNTPEGKVVYQESPCGVGAQKALDDRDQRSREQAAQARKAEEQKQSARAADLRQQWAACNAKKDCVDLCYGIGERLAVVYLVNFRTMAANDVMASDAMGQGCEKEAGALSGDCVRQCESGFKLKAKAALKGN